MDGIGCPFVLFLVIHKRGEGERGGGNGLPNCAMLIPPIKDNVKRELMVCHILVNL